MTLGSGSRTRGTDDQHAFEAPEQARRVGPAELLVLAAVAVHLAVALSLRHFPYQDITNHLARYALMARYWFGSTPDWIEVRLIPTPYIAVDLIGVGLVQAFGARVTRALMTVVAVVLLPLGMYLLLRRTAPERRGWALAGVPFTFSWYFVKGFFNYAIGVGLAFLWLAAWWPHRATTRWTRRLGLMAGAAGLFLVHLSAALAVLVVVWITWLWDLLADYRRGARVAWRDARFANVLLWTAAVFVVWGWAGLATRELTDGTAGPVFRPAAQKLEYLLTPFFSLTFAQLALMVAGWVLAAIAYVVCHRRGLRPGPFLLSALAFLVLYLIFPAALTGIGHVDVRWLPFAFLLPFCMPAATREGPPTAVLAMLFGLGLLHAALVWRTGRQVDAELAAFDAVLEQVPAGATILPLVVEPPRPGGITPYRHHALWHVIDHGGRVPGLLTGQGQSETDAPLEHFLHFVEPRQLYYPNESWLRTNEEEPDWERVRRDYDYVIQAGENERAGPRIATIATELHRVGDVTLYRVRRAER